MLNVLNFESIKCLKYFSISSNEARKNTGFTLTFYLFFCLKCDPISRRCRSEWYKPDNSKTEANKEKDVTIFNQIISKNETKMSSASYQYCLRIIKGIWCLKLTFSFYANNPNCTRTKLKLKDIHNFFQAVCLFFIIIPSIHVWSILIIGIHYWNYIFLKKVLLNSFSNNTKYESDVSAI